MGLEAIRAHRSALQGMDAFPQESAIQQAFAERAMTGLVWSEGGSRFRTAEWNCCQCGLTGCRLDRRPQLAMPAESYGARLPG